MTMANPDCFPINQLPDHILLEIFLRIEQEVCSVGSCRNFPCRITKVRQHVEFPCRPNNLLPPIASVCSRWRQLYFQPVMWRSKVVRLEYVNKLRHQFNFFGLLNRMAGDIRNLKVVNPLNCNSHLSHSFLRLSPTFPFVEKLIFGSYTPRGDFDLLVDLFPAIQSVKLYNAHLLQMASEWINLREFNISSHEMDIRVTVAGLIRFVQLANHIESISINKFPIFTDWDFEEITQLLGVGLKSIKFGYNQEVLSELAIESLVRNCPDLEQICLRVPLPIGRLKDLTQLKRLKLKFSSRTANFRDIKFRDCQGFEDLFSRPLGQLRSFKAEGISNLTDSQLELIANSCPQLESLSLNVPFAGLITDSGLAHIVDKCRNLRLLSLSGFPLLTDCSFVGAAAKLPNLSSLMLNGCENLDPEMVRRAFVRSTRVHIKSDLHGPWDSRRF